MRKHFGVLPALLLAVALLSPTSASAATEFGDNCVANEATSTDPVTVFGITATGNPLSLTSPVSGVMTQWKSVLVPAPVFIPQTLKVLRPAGPGLVQIIGEASGTITGGVNTFDTRISVQVGDRVALFGAPTFGNLVCQTPGVEQVIGGFIGPGGGVGSTVPHVVQETEVRIPVTGVVEPDVDNDGFGDETQDKCPQSAAAQSACPVVGLSASAVAKRGLVTVLVTSSIQASVTVAGTVRLGKSKTASLNGGTQVVAPGTTAKFTLLFPKKLKNRLKQLSPKRRLTLNLVSTTPNVVGAPTISTLTAKLKGQKKPKPKGKAKGKKAKD